MSSSEEELENFDFDIISSQLKHHYLHDAESITVEDEGEEIIGLSNRELEDLLGSLIITPENSDPSTSSEEEESDGYVERARSPFEPEDSDEDEDPPEGTLSPIGNRIISLVLQYLLTEQKHTFWIRLPGAGHWKGWIHCYQRNGWMGC
jgi:hypothetical protein